MKPHIKILDRQARSFAGDSRTGLQSQTQCKPSATPVMRTCIAFAMPPEALPRKSRLMRSSSGAPSSCAASTIASTMPWYCGTANTRI